MSPSTQHTNETLSRAFAAVTSVLGDGQKTLRGGHLTVRYAALPEGIEGLASALESIGAKLTYALVAPVSMSVGGGVRLEAAGVLDSVHFLASGAGELGLTDVEIGFYGDAADADSSGDRTLFQILDRVFAAPGVNGLLGRYVTHSLDNLGPKPAKRLARDLAEALADYLSN